MAPFPRVRKALHEVDFPMDVLAGSGTTLIGGQVEFCRVDLMERLAEGWVSPSQTFKVMVSRGHDYSDGS